MPRPGLGRLLGGPPARVVSPARVASPAGVASLALVASLTVAVPAFAQRDAYPWESMVQQAFDVQEGGTLEIDVDDADVTVGNAAQQRAEIDIRLRSNDMEWARQRFEEENYRARMEGNRVIVESDRVRAEDWQRNRWMSVLVEVRVPARFDLDLRTNDGDVTLASFEGNARVVTQDGDLGIDTLSGSSIDLRSQDGDIDAVTIRGDSVAINSQDGDIRIETLGGAGSLHTSDGDIRIVAADSDDLELDSSDGDVSVGIDESTRLSIRTADGDISIMAPGSLRADVDLQGEDVAVQGSFRIDGRVTRHRTEGRINGGGVEIRARSGDGSVRLVEQSER